MQVSPNLYLQYVEAKMVSLYVAMSVDIGLSPSSATITDKTGDIWSKSVLLKQKKMKLFF